MSPRMGEEVALALALEGEIHAAQGDTAQLVSLAGTLASLPEPQIDPRFAAMLEARLLTEDLVQAQTPHLTLVSSVPATPADEVVRVAAVVQMPRRKFVVRRSIAAVAAAATLSAFPLAAAAQSLPGTPFYGLKTSIERAQLALFGTPVEDAFTETRLTERRLTEVEQLIALGASDDLVGATLRAAEGHLARAGRLIQNTADETALTRFSAMVSDIQDHLRALTPQGFEGQAARDAALETSEDLQEQIAEALGLRPSPSQLVPVSPVAVITPVAPSKQSARQSAEPARVKGDVDEKKDDAKDKLRELPEGCTPLASGDLAPYGAGDALAFTCRTSISAVVGP